MIAATIAKAMGGKEARNVKPADFIPEWDRPPQTWQQQLAVVKSINRSLGGEVKGD